MNKKNIIKTALRTVFGLFTLWWLITLYVLACTPAMEECLCEVGQEDASLWYLAVFDAVLVLLYYFLWKKTKLKE